jgi:pyruvate,water dikinase
MAARFQSLDHLDPAAIHLAGGKACQCARLKQHGFPVPDGIVVTADVNDRELDRLGSDPWFDRWPHDTFAVRSSGVEEDAAGHSFAGIHETRLHVPREAITQAVRACRASSQSERARAYRQAQQITGTVGPTPVLVQRMVRAVAAGIAFTVDPVTGADTEMVINAVWGLADTLVDGRVDPDEFRVQKQDGTVLAARVGTSAGANIGAAAASLTTAQVRELAKMLVAIEGHYRAPQDVEWCHDGAQFWIVQSRPITGIGGGSSGVEWTRANLAEVLPELTSPQALAASEEILNIAERRHMGRILAPESELGPVVKSFYGRLYFNLAQFRRACLVGGMPAATLLRSLGHAGEIRPADEIAGRPPLRLVLRALPDIVRLVGRHRRAAPLMRAHQRKIEEFLARMAAADPVSLSDEDVWSAISEWRRQAPETLQVVLVFGGVLYHEVPLRKICARVGFPFERLLYSQLATGERSVSAQQAIDLVALARVARSDVRAARWLETQPLDVVEMRRALAGTAFLDSFERFLADYGHRGRYESDWALPRYNEDPTPLLQAIRLHIADDEGRDDRASEARAAAEAAAVWTEFEGRCSRWQRITLLPRARRLVRTIKQYYVFREQCRSDMVRAVSAGRRWHLALAQRFVDRGWLERVDDYFLLHQEEIGRVIADHDFAPRLQEIAASRAAEWERHSAMTMPLLMREADLPRLIRDAGVVLAGDDDEVLHGLTVSPGTVEGEVVVIHDPYDVTQMKRGAILVARATDPAWTPLFTLASGVIVEVGGVLSHASTIAREYGLPALANVRQATTRLRTGDRVRLDATAGTVQRLP